MTIIIITSAEVPLIIIDKVGSLPSPLLIRCSSVEEAIDWIETAADMSVTQDTHIFLDVQGRTDSEKRRLKRVARKKGVPDSNIRLADLYGSLQIDNLRKWLDELKGVADESSRRQAP